MRRLTALFLLALHLWAVPCDARVMILYRNRAPSTDVAVNEGYLNHQRALKLLTQTLDSFGAEYDVFRTSGVKSEWIRLAQYVTGWGTENATVTQYDAVIALGASQGTNLFGVRLDSLTLCARINSGGIASPGISKPILWLADNSIDLQGGSLSWADNANAASACTTGTTLTAKTNPTIGQINYQNGSADAFWPHAYTSGWTLNATPPAGGIRKHILASDNTYEGVYNQQGKTCTWCDSTNFARSDTVFFWERPMSHISGSAPILFGTFYGAGASYDSLANADASIARPTAEGSIEMLMVMLARLDSIAGGNVLGDKKILRKAITIDGGFTRNSRIPNVRGLYVDDSTLFKRTLDSLASRNIPAVLGVNIDSVASYPSEINWWAGWTRLKYAPQNWAGLDSAAASGNASWSNPRDVWGRWRSRQFVLNTSTNTDSSLKTLLRAQLWKTEQQFGRNRTSRFALPPQDDWSPLNVRGNSGPSVDSVLYALGEAGYTGVRINLQSPESKAEAPGPGRTNPRGYLQRQGYYREPYGGRTLKLLGHNFTLRSAGTRQSYAWPDSSPAYANAYVPLIYPAGEALWMGMITDWDRNHDNFQSTSGTVIGADWYTFKEQAYSMEDMYNPPVRAAIMRFHVSDLAGSRNGLPTRPAWLIIKSADNAMRTINRLAGRTVVAWSYPEEIEP